VAAFWEKGKQRKDLREGMKGGFQGAASALPLQLAEGYMDTFPLE
jgi:hypothetical protein